MTKIENIILAFERKYDGNWVSIYNAISSKEKPTDDDLTDTLAAINDGRTDKPFTIVSKDYPDILKHISRPPFVVWKDGDKTFKDFENAYLVLGDNTFGIDENSVVKFHSFADAIYLDKTYIKVLDHTSFMNTALALCKALVITKILDKSDEDFISSALINGKVIYVMPTLNPSLNNSLIKRGANLIDKLDDLND